MSVDLCGEFYLSFVDSVENEDVTGGRMRGRVDVDEGNPIPSRETSRCRPMYLLCDNLFRDAAFGFELNGIFELLTNASSGMYVGEKEYSYSLSKESWFVGSHRIIDQEVQLKGVGSWKASGECSRLIS